MSSIVKKTLVVSVPLQMYRNYKKSSAMIGKTVSEMTREMITAFIDGDLRIKKDTLEYEQRIELNRKLYSKD